MVRKRSWAMPPGLFRAVRRHRGDLRHSWHPDGRWVQIDDPATGPVLIHIVSAGSGPDLILLHGYVQSCWCWRHNITALAEHFTVHGVCALGFGWSEKPPEAGYRLADRADRTTRLMDVLQIETAHMCGNSLGGALALHLAATRPDRVGKVVLVNPASPGRYPMAGLATLMRPQWRHAFSSLPGVGAGLWLGLQAAAYRGVNVDEAYMRNFLAPLADDGAIEAALTVARFYNRDLNALRRRLTEVRSPSLLVLGSHDLVMPPSVSGRIADLLTANEVSVFEQSAHCPHEEEPRRFNDEVATFLRAN
jgi:pimeloyl-ACP methyl ester carboxylesterase